MMQFEDMSNELILCIWDQLVSADVIYSFSNLNARFNLLLLEFHDLYKQLDLRYCSLSACRFFCQQIPIIIEWRVGLTILKLGNCYRCSQSDMLAEEVIKSVVAHHFVKTGKSSAGPPKDIFDILMTYSKYIEPIFPQLLSLVVFQSVSISESFLNCLLYVVAGGVLLRRFIFNLCANQTHHSRTVFDWLFRCSINLVNCKIRTPPCEDGFELQYEHTVINNYVPHYSLVFLKINILNLTTLYVLLHYLPQLEHLDVYISSIYSNNIDPKLAIKLNYPKNLRFLNLRHFRIEGRDCSSLEQLVEKFSNTLEEFSLYLAHYCKGEVGVCFDGYRLMTLSSKLSRLRCIHFAINIPFLEHPNRQILAHFIEPFGSSFWLNGPLGRIEVCVNYNQVLCCVQICSLPYVFPDNTVFHTIDLVDTLFNYIEENKQIQNDLSMTFAPLWHGTKWLFLSFIKNQRIPISFLHALQYSYSQDKVLVISRERGILPENIGNHLQCTHFTELQIKSSFDINGTDDFTQLINWLRLLPNIKCLYLDSDQLKLWSTHIHYNKYLNGFLENLDRLYVNCSSIINMDLNEETMLPLLSLIINKERFSNLQYLRFIECKHISSSWFNINKWIDFIFIHINEHQLKCLRFDFTEKDQELTDIKTSNEIIAVIDSSYIVDIQRFMSENCISFWIHRK